MNSPEFIPTYPTNLPGAVQGDLIVPLAPFGKELLRDVFMKIEKRESPTNFPVREAAEVAVVQIRTIGQFYGRIKEVIQAGGAGLFTGDPGLIIAYRLDRSLSFSVV